MTPSVIGGESSFPSIRELAREIERNPVLIGDLSLRS
jgi:hypothetical protein